MDFFLTTFRKFFLKRGTFSRSFSVIRRLRENCRKQFLLPRGKLSNYTLREKELLVRSVEPRTPSSNYDPCTHDASCTTMQDLWSRGSETERLWIANPWGSCWPCLLASYDLRRAKVTSSPAVLQVSHVTVITLNDRRFVRSRWPSCVQKPSCCCLSIQSYAAGNNFGML